MSMVAVFFTTVPSLNFVLSEDKKLAEISHVQYQRIRHTIVLGTFWVKVFGIPLLRLEISLANIQEN